MINVRTYTPLTATKMPPIKPKPKFTKKQLYRFANATPLQTLARIRNFNKYRLVGFFLNEDGLTPEEVKLFRYFRKTLLESWDANSVELGLKPLNKKQDE